MVVVNSGTRALIQLLLLKINRLESHLSVVDEKYKNDSLIINASDSLKEVLVNLRNLYNQGLICGKYDLKGIEREANKLRELDQNLSDIIIYLKWKESVNSRGVFLKA
ncbi:hypothetical protein [Mangrovimonas aestuarii]|uniref:hypothetical protein n=1 Tax=Mangrovimonas aestuarii TaxID=3018443 RepID=UPI002379E165|nr:hypothetical protein [Mangrovimonas aestuarii]